MPIPIYKNGSNKKRLILYPISALVLAALAYLGWAYEPEPDASQRLSSAEMLVRMGSYELAETEVQLVLDEEPEDLHALLVLGMVKEKRLQEAHAIRIYEQARELSQDQDLNRDIDLSLIDLERRLKRYENAEKRLHSFEKAYGKVAKGERLSGLVAWEMGRVVEALDHFEAACAAAPEDSELSLLLAGALIECRRAQAARDVLESLRADVGKRASGSWNELARLFMESGDEQSAVMALKKCVELDESALKRLKGDEFWLRHADRELLRPLIGS